MLISNVADNLFENVFKRDQAFKRPIFVNDKGKMISALEKRVELILQWCRLGNKPGFFHDLGDIEPIQIATKGSYSSQKILGVENTNNLFLISSV